MSFLMVLTKQSGSCGITQEPKVIYKSFYEAYITSALLTILRCTIPKSQAYLLYHKTIKKSTLHRDLNDSVAFIFKQLIRLGDLCERIGMRDQRLGIKLAIGNEFQRLFAVATINAAGLECQILAVHIRQRQGLRLVVKCHHSDDGIRALRV